MLPGHFLFPALVLLSKERETKARIPVWIFPGFRFRVQAPGRIYQRTTGEFRKFNGAQYGPAAFYSIYYWWNYPVGQEAENH